MDASDDLVTGGRFPAFYSHGIVMGDDTLVPTMVPSHHRFLRSCGIPEQETAYESPKVFDAYRPLANIESQIMSRDGQWTMQLLLFSCWLMDAKESLDYVRALSATCMLWACIRPRVCWIFLPPGFREFKDKVLLAPFGVQALMPLTERQPPEQSGQFSMEDASWVFEENPTPVGQPQSLATMGWHHIRIPEPIEIVQIEKYLESEIQEEATGGVQDDSAYEPLDFQEEYVEGLFDTMGEFGG